MAVMTKEEFAQHVKSDTLPMYRLAYSILQNSADAEDAVSEAIVHAYEGDVSIRCAAVAENGLYVGGFTTDGRARVEYLPYGSGARLAACNLSYQPGGKASEQFYRRRAGMEYR